MHYGIKDSVGARTLDYESGSLSSIPSLPFNLLRLSMWCHNSLTSRTFRQCCFCWAKYPLFGSIWVFYWIFWFSSKSFRLGKQSLGASRGSTLSLVFICPQVVKCLVICASSLRVLCSVLLNKEYLETEEGWDLLQVWEKKGSRGSCSKNSKSGASWGEQPPKHPLRLFPRYHCDQSDFTCPGTE